MKNFLKGKNDITSRKFLEKFITKKKKNINKNENDSSLIENTNTTPLKTNVSDYNSIDWLMKFTQKKKNKFFEKNKEDINRIKTSRNSLKKFSNYKYNIINNNYLKNSTKNLKYNFGVSYQGGKKGISLEKKNIPQMKFIKQLKEELKQNPEKFNDKNKSINKKTEKIKNIKIKKVKSNENKRKTYSSSFNIILKEKKNKDNENKTLKNKIKTEGNENDDSIRLYNKFKSKSGDLEKETYPKRINSQKESQKKTNIIKAIKNHNEQSKQNLKLNNNLKTNQEIIKKKNKKIKNLEINTNDDIKTFSYHNMKIKISQNPKSKQNTYNKKNKNNLVLPNTEIINSITTIKLKTYAKNKNSFLNENKPLSLSEDPSRTIKGNLLRNKYRDLIYEYQSEIDS